MEDGMGNAREVFGSVGVRVLLGPFLKDAIVDGDVVFCLAGSEAIGRLASLSSTNFLTGQIKDLVDTVVNNWDPYGCAGCALAFGSIYMHVGGLAAGPLLKTTVNVLMSLSNDPHPVVHFLALRALLRVISAAGLSYAPFIHSTLDMLLKVSLSESHEMEGGMLGNSNASGDCPVYPIMCQIIDALITVLGLDIQESARTRTLILNLVNLFKQGDQLVPKDTVATTDVEHVPSPIQTEADHSERHADEYEYKGDYVSLYTLKYMYGFTPRNTFDGGYGFIDYNWEHCMKALGYIAGLTQAPHVDIIPIMHFISPFSHGDILHRELWDLHHKNHLYRHVQR
ncbi:hypothetical protein BDQ17DRAFT_779829 [Cyathus striatus]|nr:hypothetical protein BDQ17DRAFT_779829 [Cyathus striatus]